MAKKKPATTVRIEFVGTGIVIENVIFKSIPLMPGMTQYAHIEQKGNSWLFLHTEGMLFDELCGENETRVLRSFTKEPTPRSKTPTLPIVCLMTADDRPLAVTRYTVLTAMNANKFYFLDELPDHTFRICHETKWFPGTLHEQVTAIKITKE